MTEQATELMLMETVEDNLCFAIYDIMLDVTIVKYHVVSDDTHKLWHSSVA